MEIVHIYKTFNGIIGSLVKFAHTFKNIFNEWRIKQNITTVVTDNTKNKRYAFPDGEYIHDVRFNMQCS